MSFFAKIALVLSVILTVALGTSTILLASDQTNDERVEEERREQEACDTRDAIVEAFDALPGWITKANERFGESYTDALVVASDRERTPEEEAAVRESIERLEAALAERMPGLEEAARADLAELLAPLGPTDC